MMSTRLVVDGTLRRVHTTGGRPSATDLDSAASFFAFVANRAGLQNTAAATSLLSDYAQVLGHDTSALTEDHENQGLDIAELAALKETTYPAESVKMSECPVCLTAFKDGQRIKQLPCEHAFCATCTNRWFHSHPTCPLCRHDCRFANGFTPQHRATRQQSTSPTSTMAMAMAVAEEAENALESPSRQQTSSSTTTAAVTPPPPPPQQQQPQPVAASAAALPGLVAEATDEAASSTNNTQNSVPHLPPSSPHDVPAPAPLAPRTLSAVERAALDEQTLVVQAETAISTASVQPSASAGEPSSSFSDDDDGSGIGGADGSGSAMRHLLEVLHPCRHDEQAHEASGISSTNTRTTTTHSLAPAATGLLPPLPTPTGGRPFTHHPASGSPAASSFSSATPSTPQSPASPITPPALATTNASPLRTPPSATPTHTIHAALAAMPSPPVFSPAQLSPASPSPRANRHRLRPQSPTSPRTGTRAVSPRANIERAAINHLSTTVAAAAAAATAGGATLVRGEPAGTFTRPSLRGVHVAHTRGLTAAEPISLNGAQAGPSRERTAAANALVAAIARARRDLERGDRATALSAARQATAGAAATLHPPAHLPGAQRLTRGGAATERSSGGGARNASRRVTPRRSPRAAAASSTQSARTAGGAAPLSMVRGTAGGLMATPRGPAIGPGGRPRGTTGYYHVFGNDVSL
jgi:hypothetical protein